MYKNGGIKQTLEEGGRALRPRQPREEHGGSSRSRQDNSQRERYPNPCKGSRGKAWERAQCQLDSPDLHHGDSM